MYKLSARDQERLAQLGQALVDHRQANVIVPPARDASGFWFGGGNCVRDPGDGSLLLIGRYRDAGDSRTGLAAGPRGRELAVFRSVDDGRTFTKLRSWGKEELYCGSEVLSIEGSALRLYGGGIDVLYSTEKAREYPEELAGFQKPGTGVWSIDRFAAGDVVSLDPSKGVHSLLRSDDPAYLHVKDPNVSPGLRSGEDLLLYCCHPYCWSSSTSGYAVLRGAECLRHDPDFFPRGPAWDVAATRITCRLPVPRVGAFADCPPVSLYFYDGAECLREHEAHKHAVGRPRGYSCEELGGLAYGLDDDFPHLHRLSRLAPAFISPQGTGANRYVSVLPEVNGDLFAIWEQSAASCAQPLMAHRLTAVQVRNLLD